MSVRPLLAAAVIVAVGLSTLSRSAAQDAKPPAATESVPAVTAALRQLRKDHVAGEGPLMEMTEMDFLIHPAGGGSCASAAGVVVLQAGRAMLGRDWFGHPHRAALAAFRDQEALLGGRVTNNQFVRLLQFHERYLGGGGFETRVLSAPNSPHAQGGDVWEADAVPAVRVRPGELQVLSYTVTTAEGGVLGRHFVIVIADDGNRLEVLDPARPKRDSVFEIVRGDRGCGRVYLRVPADVDVPDRVRTYVNELNTVFTVRATADAPPRAPGLKELIRHIDRTAEELREENQLRDPRAWREAGAAYGLPGLDLPGHLGGSGWTASEVLPVFRHAGRIDLNLRDVVGGAHARVLLNSGEDAALDVVRRTARGEAYVAITITEPGAGTDFTSMAATAERVDGGYRLSGEKRWNARLDEATDIIGITKATTGVVGRLSVFVLPRDAEGVEVETVEAHGLTGNSYGGLDYNGVTVPADRLVGVDGEGKDVFRRHFLYWRLMQVAAAIGCGEGALNQMAARMKERDYRGAKLMRMSHLQQQLARSTTELKMAYSLAEDAAALLDAGKYDEAEPLIDGLKAEGVEAALRAADSAMRAHGGLGYSIEVDLGDRVRDLMGLRIADGTTDAMRSAVVSLTYGPEFFRAAFPRVKAERPTEVEQPDGPTSKPGTLE